MLRSGVRPSVVSKKVGFADQPHMTRVFRDELGVTPRRFWVATSATG
jgi:AraC-like DNA-binding protein